MLSADAVGPAAADSIDRALFGTDPVGIAGGFQPDPRPEPIVFTREVPLPAMTAEEAAEAIAAQSEPQCAHGPRPDRPVSAGTGSAAVVATIRVVAAQTAVDPSYMMALADKESSFDPDAKAKTSSAEGLYQFIDQTWLDAIRSFGLNHGLIVEAASIDKAEVGLSLDDAQLRRRVMDMRRDPYWSALMAAEMLKRDTARIEAEIGRPVTAREYYLAHFLGPSGAERLLKLVASEPKAAAAKKFPAAARANRSIFFARKGRKSRSKEITEVYGLLTAMMERRMDRYEARERRVAALAGSAE